MGECCCHGLIFSPLVDPRLILSTDNTNTSEVLTKRYPTGCDSLYAWFYDMFGVVRGFFYT